jgi:glycosyltransferase involved in cell wall biosynthesis
MNFELSLIIRAYNEAEKLKELLINISEQDFPKEKLEIIVVDNGSKDSTASVAKEFGATVVSLPQEEFNYPRSSNLGIAAASAPVVALLSAHTTLWRKDCLSCIPSLFIDPLVAGVYGPVLSVFKSSWLERCITLPKYWAAQLRGTTTITQEKFGILGATNCAIRKGLWCEHPFDEAYGTGAEDGAWAAWALAKGLRIVFEPRFAVHHSHNLSTVGYLQQQRLWRKYRNNP